ncbi:sulfatase-like hydrolase/transferase, partial [Candidatus Woesearchaeota archaeon]|nr:sulfatase-like hydrolase/transferase [Candidatus Woesearchaeota archaeon]
KEFKTNKIKLNITTMYDYEDKIKFKSLFKKIELKNTLSQIISKNKLKQLKIAESEKYAHVTYFFNGGQEKKFKNENRIIIASPKVKTYDQSPKMSAKQITDHIIKNENKFDIIIANFANADMVGHTGNINATKQAVEYLDVCIKKIVKTLNKKTKILITADHGNCENMKGKWNKSHTLSKVPFILLNTNYKKIKSENASLKNIAPTILKLLNIKKSKEMNTKSLI